MNNRVKILFHLTRDSDDYPPADWEHLWAISRENDEYEIDNIPFFVKAISSGDIVRADNKNGELIFDRVIQPSGHSTIRVIMFDIEQKDTVRAHLSSLGCETEGSHLQELFSVDVPPGVRYDPVIAYLKYNFDQNVLDYEEAAQRHVIQ